MTDAFTLNSDGKVSTPQRRQNVLVTGAAGHIGSYFSEQNADRYDLRLMLTPGDTSAESLKKWGTVVEGDLVDLPSLKAACEGIDTVVNMAGNPSPNATWDTLLQPNIIGVYNIFTAAKSQGCKRVVHASSIHAVSGYPADVQVKSSDPVNPGDLYGVTKCFNEALGRYMAEQEGLSVICLRIGAFQPPEKARKRDGVRWMDAWVSRRDLNQLIQLSVDAVGVQFAIFNGLSDNRFKRLDISGAREVLGYAPVDDATEVNEELRPLHLDERVMAHSHQDAGTKSGLRDQL